VAEEREDKPEGDADAGRETAVGQPVVDAGAVAAGADAGAGATEVHYTSEPGAQPAAAPEFESGGTSPAAADREAADSHDPFTDKPELFVAGAFVGAFVVAKILKKLTGADD
jgi:hypothetical protein